jgi:hypothetical protein
VLQVVGAADAITTMTELAVGKAITITENFQAQELIPYFSKMLK